MGNAGGGGGGGLGTGGNGNAAALAVNGMNDALVHESTWDEVFPLLDAHFFQLVPAHLYEQFLNHVSHLSRILLTYMTLHVLFIGSVSLSRKNLPLNVGLYSLPLIRDHQLEIHH